MNQNVHQISFTHSLTIEESPEKVFNFFRHLDRHYLNLNKGHKKFKITNTDELREGAWIECEETAGGQDVRHKYQVVKFEANHALELVSEKSRVTIGKLLNMTVKTIVEFEIQAIAPGTSKISSRIILKFKNQLEKFFAAMIGTERIWQAHTEEELANGARIIRSATI